MSKKSQVRKNWPKYLLQWGTLATIVFFISGLAKLIFPKSGDVNPEAYCPMGGLEALTTYLTRGSLPCSMTTLQIMMGIVLAIAVILFSKLFCGYLCPVGTVEDLMSKLRKALHIKELKIRNGSIADKALRIVKYLLLFWIFYMTATSSELFCKNLDPYYAVATGFKGEITLWMSIITLTLVLVLGFVVDSFWCRYICPLGAVSNTFKFWLWVIVAFAAWFCLGKAGLDFSWVVFLGIFCVMGYLLEILCGKPKFQVLHVVKNESVCNGCGLCVKTCPYHINIKDYDGKVNSVDCTLCGECTAVCSTGALNIGFCKKQKSAAWKLLPALLAVGFLFIGITMGKKYELPTINETWGIEAYNADSVLVQLVDPSTLKTMEMENLKTVKCFGSSMAFKAKCEKIAGTHGVKTFVGSHRVVITYDPAVTNPDKIREAVFVPSKFRVQSPDPKSVDSIKVVTIRTEKMFDKLDLNYLGLQFRLTGNLIYGLESEFACPLIVRVYMDPSENPDAAWFKEVVNKKVLAMPIHGGGVKETPVDFEFVKMEDGVSYVSTADFLHMMFDPFNAQYNGSYDDESGDKVVRKRAEVYQDKDQFIYEIADQNYEKPIIKKALPFLSNHISREEGVIGMSLDLNKELVPAIMIRYSAPMTEDKLWELITMDTWTITYKKDDVREEAARMKFETKGIVYPYEK